MQTLWRNLSLRSRLTALSIGLLASLLGALGNVLYLNLRKFLLDSTALRVRAQAKPVIERQFAQAQQPNLDAMADDLSRALTSRDTTATIFDRSGQWLADGRRLPEEPLAAAPRRADLKRALAGEKDITYTTAQQQRRAQIALIPLRRAPHAPEVLGVAQLTTPLTEVDQILSRQRRMIGLGVILTLGLGILGEWWLTRSSLAPLQRVIATMRRIASGDLSQRVQLPHTRDEVGQLAAAFDHMAGNIETAFASQSRFVSAAAHELRTPLTALQGSLEVLQRGSQDDPAAARALLQGMHREVVRLNRLTDQLLALTRLDAPEALHIQCFNLADFLNDVLQQVQFLIGERQLHIEHRPSVELEADPDLLTQVFFNLIDNAVQHTDPHGTLEIGWRPTGSNVMMWVRDNGEGIAPDDLPHIFEPFYRGDRSRSRRRGGSGLGLAIVQTIVAAHGGQIEVDSQPDRGSHFTITLPVQRSH
jgi:two-component system, OmpR family, sensor kinase